jgi:phosphosulfolactate synthase (CoM biosynthesis protein A)
VFLKLDTPVPGGHTIEYTVSQGDADEVARVANALGFEHVTDKLLEVRRA